MRWALLVLAAVVGLAGGCDGRATQYLQAAKEVEVEEARLNDANAKLLAIQNKLNEISTDLGKLTNAPIAAFAPQAAKEHADSVKLLNAMLTDCESQLEKATKAVASQEKIVTAARARRDALAPK